MTIERGGYRRLYDAIGCGLVGQDELYIEAPVGDLRVGVYLGSKPKFGVTVIRSDKYIVGEEIPSISFEHGKDAIETHYPRNFFMEISCSKHIEVPQQLSDSYRANDVNARNELFSHVQADRKTLEMITDFVAGTIGLRLHRQFALEVIIEDFYIQKDSGDYDWNADSPSLEVLEDPQLNSIGMDMLRKWLSSIGQYSSKDLRFKASALDWLLRAWSERDVVSKFMALFIPIEIILKGYGSDPKQQEEATQKSSQIRALIEADGGTEAKNLLAFFNQLQQPRPSLNLRFEAMARKAQIDGWEVDVVAFRRFNETRNKLMHQGEQEVILMTSINEELIEETRGLEDIAERYISFALFEDANVYQSRWRPVRKKPTGT